ncbi:PEP-CTERM sorting domain-containing protein [Duganella callida]|nr:PEP-CTERM sorting domain-containing protein [Duganella callida]
MKKICVTALFWLGCLGALAPARALQITLVPHGGYQIAPGETLLVDLAISGLQSGGLSSELGAYHLDLYYDPDLLSYLPGAPSAWGTALGQPGNTALAQADTGTPGLLRLDEISLLDGATLDALQDDSFLLATLAFKVQMPPGPAPANTILFADDVLLGDAAGNRIPAALSDIPLLILQVDEPATAAIFGLGLAALAWRRRRGAAC